MPLAISVPQAGPGPIRGLARLASPLRRPRPVGAASLRTRFQKYDNGTWSPSPTASRSPLSQSERAISLHNFVVSQQITALSLWERGDREAVGEGELIRYRTFETVNLGKDPGQNGKNGGTNPSNSCIIINMTQKTNLEQT